MISPLTLLLLPFILLFEVGQLVLCERYIGVKHIGKIKDPSTQGPPELLAFLWVLAIVGYWLWMLGMLVPGYVRLQILCMLCISVAGIFLRRITTLKWTLVILTLEGAIRIGMLCSIGVSVWKRI